MYRHPYSQGYLCWELVIAFALCACMMTLSSPYYHRIVAETTALQQDIAHIDASL